MHQQGNGTPPEGSQTEPFKIPEWLDALLAEAKGSPEEMQKLARFQIHAELAKGYLELDSRLGKSLSVPDRSAGAALRAAFWEKAGKPKTKEGYSVAKEENSAAFIEAAYNANLTEEQAAAFHKTLKFIGGERIPEGYGPAGTAA
ncbi:hypothetical protein [Treponema endosymbiont of Eucomonympha sp.]|uniref:hypothetical protein n=1 Tax=Treponema endosymbiont of Eucomonympha sp. TaxID=1580831 RepID=UPI0016508760|nr:hypothetical protein [Treponema endosymbiont of Eucomonympha sp.]